MTLFEGVTILNLVILLYVVYNISGIDTVMEEVVTAVNEMWKDHEKRNKDK